MYHLGVQMAKLVINPKFEYNHQLIKAQAYRSSLRCPWLHLINLWSAHCCIHNITSYLL